MNSSILHAPRELRSLGLFGMSLRTLAAAMLIALAFAPLRLCAQGFNGTLSLACSGGVTNSTCSVTPNTMAVAGQASAQATLTLPANICASGGTLNITFTATYAGAQRTATANLTVR